MILHHRSNFVDKKNSRKYENFELFLNFLNLKHKVVTILKIRLFYIFTFSSWMRRYWFYVKNDFQNFHQIFTFWDTLSQKKRFSRKCLSVCLSTHSYWKISRQDVYFMFCFLILKKIRFFSPKYVRYEISVVLQNRFLK